MMTMGSSISAVAMFNNTTFGPIEWPATRHAPSWADFIIGTPVFKFSVHAVGGGADRDPTPIGFFRLSLWRYCRHLQ